MIRAQHCVKSVRIRSCSGPHFSAFELNTDQINSEYGHVLRNATVFTSALLSLSILLLAHRTSTKVVLGNKSV